MSDSTPFHRIEDASLTQGPLHMDKRTIICSFETDRFGYVQIEYKRFEDGTTKLSTPPNEPDLRMFTEKKHLEFKCICAIVFRLVFETPAAKDRLP